MISFFVWILTLPPPFVLAAGGFGIVLIVSLVKLVAKVLDGLGG